MSGDPRIPTIDRGVSISSGLITKASDEASSNTYTRDRSGNVVRTKLLSKQGDIIASRYELRKVLGVGAYGEVFAAWDMVRSRLVAIKILRNTRANVLMQFKQEFRGMFELSHPNLVRVYKLGRDDSVWFIVMEFIDGVPVTNSSHTHSPRTTASQLTREPTEPFAPPIEAQHDSPEQGDRDGPPDTAPLISPVLPIESIRDRIGQLSQGTFALHEFGILHCDLKPSNVMVNKEGRVIILDFGASRYTMSLGAHYQHHWIRAGTRAYMAPEARTLRESTPGLDWYAIGIMLAEMLTGLHSRVFASKSSNQRLALLQEIAARHPDYAEMCDLCAALIHPTPSLRAGHLEAMTACYGEAATPLDASPRSHTPTFSGRHKELAELHDAYAIFQNGRPHAVLVKGNVGSGKATMCEEFLRHISFAKDAPHVLVAHCKHDELLSYRAFDGIVDGLSAILRAMPPDELESYLSFCTPTLCALFPTLRTVHASLVTAEPVTASPQDALVALQALLKRIAEHRRMVIWVSDVDQADGDSLRWIARIFAPGQRPNVFLLLSSTSQTRFDGAAIDIDTLGYALPTITLEPLDARTANHAIASWLPPELRRDTALIDAIRIASSGRLLTMHALSRVPSTLSDLPENISIETLLDLRISSLDEDATHILYALAVSFDAVNSQMLSFIAKRPPTHVEKTLQDLLKQAFVVRKSTKDDERYELIDDALRQRVLHRMSEKAKQSFHEQYAAAGTSHGIDSMRPADIVAHLTHAKDYAAAESYALEIAQESDQGGAYDSAAQMYALLIQLRENQGLPVASELRLRAAECNLHSGRLLEAARLLEQLAGEATNPSDAAEVYQRAAETYIMSGHTEEGLACGKNAREQHPTRAQRYLPRLAYIMLLLKRLQRRLQDFDIEDTTNEPPNPSTLSRLRTHRMAGFDIGIVDPVTGFEFALRELELALNAGSRIPISRTLAGLSTFVAALGGKHRELAIEWAELAIELAHAAEDRTSLEWARVGRASIEYQGSNYSDAWTEIHASYLWFRENTSHQWMMLTYTSVHLVYLAYMTGRVETLRALYYGEIVEARARNNRMIEATITFAGFITWLIDDAPEAGRAVLERIEIPRAGGLYRLHDFFIMQYSAELCLYERRMDECHAHVKRLRNYETTVISRSMELTCMAARFLRGRLILAYAVQTGRLRRKDVYRLRSLARSLRKCEDMLAQGWGLQLLAGLHFLSDNHDRAASYLERTIKLYERSGVSLYVEVVRAAGRATGLLPHTGDPYEQLEQMGVVNPERFVRAHHPYI